MRPDSLAAMDWQDISGRLDGDGCALLPGLLDKAACQSLSALYANEVGFRSRIIMARHGFGRGEYRYFSYPLPPLVATLREKIYPFLVPTANFWMERMGLPPPFSCGSPDFPRPLPCGGAGATHTAIITIWTR
ncbi:2OG-Fe(II) oxygenase [Komagataeibacter diospyri]|uniref:Proline hydroxylase n=1 Tax=Komagataeibacter diospyri TaxID=1932662 RepID=A0A4P5NS45_9PROT|nr:hypothetical protein MSKU9_2699 [Komagataeibacter diospyri]